MASMGLRLASDHYYLSLFDIKLPRLEGWKRKRIAKAMSAGVPPDLIMKHCGIKVGIGPSSVDSDAEEDVEDVKEGVMEDG